MSKSYGLLMAPMYKALLMILLLSASDGFRISKILNHAEIKSNVQTRMLYQKGAKLYLQGDPTLALPYLEDTAISNPNEQTLYALSFNYLRAGNWTMALKCFDKLLFQSLHPSRAVHVHMHYGTVLVNHVVAQLKLQSLNDELENTRREALYHFQQAYRINTVHGGLNEEDSSHILNTLGRLHSKLHELDEAVLWFEKAIQQFPHQVAPYGNLALVYERLGKFDDAMRLTSNAISIMPDNALLYHNMGNILQQLSRNDEALEYFKKAIELDSSIIASYDAIAIYYGSKGDHQVALQYLHKAVEITNELLVKNPNDPTLCATLDSTLLQLANAQIPMISLSNDHIRTTRAQYEKYLRHLEAKPKLMIENPIHTVSFASLGYYAIYQALEDRIIRTQLANIYQKGSYILNYVAPHVTAGRHLQYQFNGSSSQFQGYQRMERRLRVGFLSAFMYHHSVGLLTENVIASLNKTSFEVFLLRFPSHVDDLTFRVIEQVEHHIELSTILVQAQQQVARLKLDVLIFTEIGMDFNSYFMAFSRLALRTAMFWGHAITSGINTVDYFISSKHFQELEETRTKYSECVYRMNSLTTSFPRPIQRLNNAIPLTREALGLPSKSISADIMFLVPQTLYKLHPDFDFFIEKILQQVPSGFIVFPQGSLPLLKDQIKSRMASSLSASVYERVYFVRHLNHYEFLQLCEIADLVLDPFPVGGGRSSFEIFSVATPIVMLYSRTTILQLTYGMYQAMGDEELMKSCVAFFEEEYINKAVLLAKDASKRLNMVEKIRYNNHKLYDNSQVVREWETFLYNIMEWKAPIIHNFKGGVNRIKHCPPEMDNLEENIIFQMSFFVDSRQENVPLVLRRKEDPWKVSKQFATSFVPALDFLQANFIYKILYNAQNRLDQPVVGTWTFSVPNRRSSSLTVSIHFGDDIDAVCHSIFHSKDENDAEMIQQATNVIKQQLPQHTTSEWIAARSFIPVLTNNKQKDPDQVETCVTLVMTTCKRLDLFRRTVESLKGVLGSRWGQVLCHVLVIDDNSSHEDRLIMRQLYPEFEFLMKRPDQKGHAKSLNMALDKIESSFMLYVEDDWEFLPQVHSDFIDQSLKILQFQSDPHEHLVQVLLNDQNGGWSRNLLQQHNTIHYKLHEFATVDPTHTFSYWPGFSLNPGVWDVVALKRLGINFSEEMELFERRFALDLWEKGLHVAYLPFQSAVHIGAPPGTNGSAYVLNGLPRNSIDVVTI